MNHLVKVDDFSRIFGEKSSSGTQTASAAPSASATSSNNPTQFSAFSRLFREKVASVKQAFGATPVAAASSSNVPTHYFVDYENGHAARLTGYELLKSDDKVFIVYTMNAKTAPIPLFKKLEESPVEFYWIEAPVGEQAADKYLISLFTADAAVNGTSCRYAIVSEDKGYDSCVRLVWQTFKAQTKRRSVLVGTAPSQPASSSKFPRGAQGANTGNNGFYIRSIKKLDKLTAEEKNRTVGAFLGMTKAGKAGSPKHLVYCALQQVLGADRGQEIYREFKALVAKSETSGSSSKPAPASGSSSKPAPASGSGSKPAPASGSSSKPAPAIKPALPASCVKAINGVSELSDEEKKETTDYLLRLMQQSPTRPLKELVFEAFSDVLESRGEWIYLMHDKEFD